jgi:hypothetical protein
LWIASSLEAICPEQKQHPLPGLKNDRIFNQISQIEQYQMIPDKAFTFIKVAHQG